MQNAVWMVIYRKTIVRITPILDWPKIESTQKEKV